MAHREKSTWTPRNHPPNNEKIFKERLTLFKKWFSVWNEDQKWILVEWVLKHLSDTHLSVVYHLLHPGMPPPPQDFTRVLPRQLCLRVFSYLDPQSLCRASQVCWYWKYLAEANEVWLVKCLRRGWFLPTPPSPFDQAAWKRHYVCCVSQLHWNPPQPPDAECPLTTPEDEPVISELEEGQVKRKVRRHKSFPKSKGPWIPPDWFPTDTHLRVGAFTLSGPLSRYPQNPPQPSTTTVSHPPHLNHHCTSASETIHVPAIHPKVPDSVMHPGLLEKLRLGQPSPGYSSSVPIDTQTSFYKMQDVSPFPHLPPYYVHLNSNSSMPVSVASDVTGDYQVSWTKEIKPDVKDSKETTTEYSGSQVLPSHPWVLPLASDDEDT